MISYFLRLLLITSSIAPVCFTVSFIGFINKNNYLLYMPLFFGVFVCFMCVAIVGLVKKKIQVLKKTVTSITPANKEVTSYFLAYVFPLLGYGTVFSNTHMTLFFFMCLVGYTLFSESYNFNPLLSLLGYKFYEAQDYDGIGFILLSRKNILTINPEKSIRVKQLSSYVYIYYDGD